MRMSAHFASGVPIQITYRISVATGPSRNGEPEYFNPDFPILYINAANADQWASQGVPNSIFSPGL
jgi:hypothetical protein